MKRVSVDELMVTVFMLATLAGYLLNDVPMIIFSGMQMLYWELEQIKENQIK